jgi:hypothetical protein
MLQNAAVDAINEKLKEVYWDPIKSLNISPHSQTCQTWRAKQRHSIWFLLPPTDRNGNFPLFKAVQDAFHNPQETFVVNVI